MNVTLENHRGLMLHFMLAAGVAAASFGWVREARAQWSGHEFGAGLRFGDPTGLTGKVWLDASSALQFGVGWHPGYPRYRGYVYYYPGPVVSADWVYSVTRFGPRSRKVWFGVHVGAGMALDFVAGHCYYDALGHRTCSMGVLARMPVALNFSIAKVRLEFFLEVTPAFRILPLFTPALYFSCGGRYYF